MHKAVIDFITSLNPSVSAFLIGFGSSLALFVLVILWLRWADRHRRCRMPNLKVWDMSHITTACSHDIDLLGQKERPLKREAAH